MVKAERGERAMKLGEFVGHLDGKDGLDLEFTVLGRKVSGSYHITEIKNARIESVDCGGTRNRWTEVVFQLLEPGRDDPSRRMTVGRARKIYEDASRIQPFDRDAEVIFEYEPEGAPTALLRVGSIEAGQGRAVVSLESNGTQCKPAGRFAAGTSVGSTCCGPSVAAARAESGGCCR
jgi:hypothetical protein